MKHLILFLMTSFLVPTAFSKTPPSSLMLGTSSSGGGYAVVCYDQDRSPHQIQTVTLLDIYEGQTAYKLPTWNPSVAMSDQILHAKNIFQSVLDDRAHDLNAFIDLAARNLKLIPNIAEIVKVDDVNPIIFPTKNCYLQQIAHYIDDDLLLVDETLWNHLNNTNKAALILHEGLYRFLRDDGESNSRRTRKIIAHLFGDFPFENIKSGVPSTAKRCWTKEPGKPAFDFSLWIEKKKSDKIVVHMQFYRFAGRSVFSQKTAKIHTHVKPYSMYWGSNQVRTHASFETMEEFGIGIFESVTVGPSRASRFFYGYIHFQGVDFQLAGDCLNIAYQLTGAEPH